METTKTETGTESGIVTEIIEGDITVRIETIPASEMVTVRVEETIDPILAPSASRAVDRFPSRVTSSSARRSDRRAATTVTVACLE